MLNRYLFRQLLVFSLLLPGISAGYLMAWRCLDTEPGPEEIFKKFEDGLLKGDVSEFSAFFSNRTYISLSNGVSGYYSANQAYYVLQDYLSTYKPFSFKFNNIVEETDFPYAYGIYKYDSRGIRGTIQVYISLISSGNSWQISQIAIN